MYPDVYMFFFIYVNLFPYGMERTDVGTDA